MSNFENFSAIKISIISPEKIREMSYGEVTNPEAINYRTQKPERDGLFCENIFGPMKDWECRCGKYKRIRYKGVICEKCGVEVTRAKVRRERMGHIELATPVSHIWYLRGVPSRIGLVLDMSPKALEKVIYFAAYVVLDAGNLIEIEEKQVLSDGELTDLEKRYEDRGGLSKLGVRVGMGAEAIRELLTRVDLDKECAECRDILENSSSSQKRTKAVKRIEVLEAFRKNGTKPEWLVLTVLPVLPPELRPMVQLDGGRFASSDLNDLYRRVINRNNRLKKTIELNAPDMILKNEKRMLQEAVDALLDNGRHGRPLSGPSNREYRSLAGMLRGKQGRFRQNLLGKRVDYSGRSVIVVGPELKLYQCGLPKEMAIELFKPFVMNRLIEKGKAKDKNEALEVIKTASPIVWESLEEIIKDYPVLLNRAPTLHRLSIQAFEPVLVDGKAIKINPLVCTAFNADFDGDQMAVHVPLSVEAQAEARFLMLSSNNILKLSDGKPVYQFSQDIALGAYYLTMIRREDGKYYTRIKPSQSGDEEKESSERYFECEPTDKGAEEYVANAYISEDEAIMAYQTGNLCLQDEIKVRRFADFEGEKVSDLVKTTVGYIIFNREIPQDLGFVDRTKRWGVTKYEISNDVLTSKDIAVGKKKLAQIVDRCFKTGGAAKAADVLDRIKTLGYKYSTIGAITTSVFDMAIPEAKYKICKETEDKVQAIEKKYRRGLMREEERYSAVIDAWDKATDDVTDALKGSLDKFNPMSMIVYSGAGASLNQVKQLSGMRGLIVNPTGEKMETPVKSSFREGLSVLEYFISSHGGKKGRIDTAIKTSDAGYLTRRLVDVAQDVIVREDDCMEGGKPKGLEVETIKGDNGEIIEKLYDRIQGRFTCDEVRDANGNLLAGVNTFINDDLAQKIVDAGIKKVPIRSVFTCQSRYGVCAKCYGKNMATNAPVQIGEAVGVIAAQSIGEPGTQLTMRVSHTGGISTAKDITQSIPRIEEIFEGRKPKVCATICEVSGIVEVKDSSDNLKHVIVKDPESGTVKKDYALNFNAELKVRTGENVGPGTCLNFGSLYPQDILRISGVKGVQDYILSQIQSVYRSQGVDINDKHVEIVVRQMLRKVKIEDAGGSDNLLPGETVDMFYVEDEALKAIAEGKKPPLQKRILLGITKAALATESFLSAASFQETSRVLTNAAIKSKTDPLMGLKENVIIGKLIPAGTGIKDYNNMAPALRAPIEMSLDEGGDLTLGSEDVGDFVDEEEEYSEDGLYGVADSSETWKDDDTILDPIFPDIDLSDDNQDFDDDIFIDISKFNRKGGGNKGSV